MIRNALFTLTLLVAATGFAAEPQNGSGENDGYKLVWQDLFDKGELNRDRWNIEVNGDGGGNAELQYYCEEGVSVGDDGLGNGCLILTARREEKNGRHFTSGRVNSKNNVAFLHGKVEASIKLPLTANGLWPAFWMMGNDFDQVGWPRSGETDILEMGNANGINAGTQDRYFNGAMHWGQGWPAGSYAKDCTKNYSLQDGEFHLFTAIWDDNEMRMYVDLDKHPLQVPYFRMAIPQDDPDNEWSPGNYFHKENFILFNLAVGGNFPGIHTPDGITALHEGNGHSASMYVNYVKIYQKQDGSAENFFAPDDGDEQSGIASITADNSVKIAVLRSEVRFSSEASYTLCDLSGRTVASGRGTALDTANIPAGVYLLRATGSENETPASIKIRL